MLKFSRLGTAGRLGNQLWQIAGAYGLSRSRNEQLGLPPGWDYRPYFCVPDNCFGAGDAVEAWIYATGLSERARVYLQDLDLWSEWQTEVREFFKPSPYARSLLSSIAYQEFASYRPKAALHVRRGDNASRENGDDYFPMPTLDYYAAALDLLPSGIPVFVFSDDPAWCKKILPSAFSQHKLFLWDFGGNTRPETPPGKDNPAPPFDWVDLQLMSECDYHIIANSTYSWWGAFLSQNKHPIYPLKWYGKEIDFADPRKMFTSDWIGL